MKEFNPEAHIRKMQPEAIKVIKHFKAKGFDFVPDDGHKNVIFHNETREIRVSQHSFYRFSGIACITRDKKGEKNQSETIEVTDEMFMDLFMKPIIQVMLDAPMALKPVLAK